MKEINKTEFKVGLTVFAGIIIFIVVVLWAKEIKLGSSDNQLNIHFDSVAGLEVGDKVTVSGVKKGKVEKIAIDNSGVMVEISLAKEIQLKKDASFSVMMLDLMGGKRIEINPGVSSALLDVNERQNGTFAGDISTTMAVLGSLENDIVSVIKEVNVTLASLNEILGDKELAGEMKSAVKNLNATAISVNKLIAANKSGITDLLETSNRLAENTNKLIEGNSEQFSSVLNGTNDLLQHAEKLISDLNSIADEVKNKQNNLGKLLYDDELLSNLTKTLNQANELTKLLIEQLKGDGINVKADVDLF